MITSILRRCAVRCEVIVVFMLMSMGVQAQEQTSVVMANMAANAKQLRQYSFKQRTEIYHKGELKNAKVDEIHYNTSGERVNIPIDEQKAPAEPRRRGPGARLIAKKIEEEQEKMKDYIDRLMALTSRYLASDPAKLQAAMAKAEVTPGGGSGLVRITMRDFVKSGDSMIMSFDSTTKRPTKTEINTHLDDAPVSVVLAYDQLHSGPTYPEKTVVRSDAKELELRILTYDYRL